MAVHAGAYPSIHMVSVVGDSFGPPSGLAAEAQQFHEGVEEALQPTLVGHALLHHLLLAGVLGRLLDAVGLSREWKG